MLMLLEEVLVPDARVKSVVPVDLNVCDSAVRLPAPSDTVRLLVVLESMVKIVSSVGDGTTPPVTEEADVDQLAGVLMFAPVAPAQ